MANHLPMQMNWTKGTPESFGGTEYPMNLKEFEFWRLDNFAQVAGADIADDDFMISPPLPAGDIKGDIIVMARRILGNINLQLDMEYTTNLGPCDGHGTTWENGIWKSVTGDKITWAISGTGNATPTFDYFLWDVAENGFFPKMRLAYKNETGSNITGDTTDRVYWSLFLGHSRTA